MSLEIRAMGCPCSRMSAIKSSHIYISSKDRGASSMFMIKMQALSLGCMLYVLCWALSIISVLGAGWLGCKNHGCGCRALRKATIDHEQYFDGEHAPVPIISPIVILISRTPAASWLSSKRRKRGEGRAKKNRWKKVLCTACFRTLSTSQLTSFNLLFNFWLDFYYNIKARWWNKASLALPSLYIVASLSSRSRHKVSGRRVQCLCRRQLPAESSKHSWPDLSMPMWAKTKTRGEVVLPLHISVEKQACFDVMRAPGSWFWLNKEHVQVWSIHAKSQRR